AITEVALGIDRIEAKLRAKLLAQLADVAFNDVLLDLLIEDSVNGVEDLGLGHPARRVARQIFEDTPFAPRQGERLAIDFRVAPIREDPHRTNGDETCILMLSAAPDSADARQDLANMHRLAYDIVNAGFEQSQRAFQRILLGKCNHWCIRPITDASRRHLRSGALPEQEG